MAETHNGSRGYGGCDKTEEHQHMRRLRGRRKLIATSQIALGTLCAAMVAAPASGQAFHTVNAMNTGEAWFSTNPVYSNTVWVRTDKGGVERYASGIMLDPWNMLVSGHQLFSNPHGGHTITVVMGTGMNYLTDPGWTIAASDWLHQPGWDGSLFSQRVDLGIVHIPEGVPGIEPLYIGSSMLNEELRRGGFGEPAVNGQWQGVDGKGRGFKMWVDRFGTVGGTVSSDYI